MEGAELAQPYLLLVAGGEPIRGTLCAGNVAASSTMVPPFHKSKRSLALLAFYMVSISLPVSKCVQISARRHGDELRNVVSYTAKDKLREHVALLPPPISL